MNFYIVGMKSYGRAPTFLLAIGSEQVRSVVAYLTKDIVGANEVHLELPETGVCSTNIDSIRCSAEISTLKSEPCCVKSVVVLKCNDQSEMYQIGHFNIGRCNMLVKHKQPVVALSLITEICFAGDPMLYTVLPIHRKEVGLTS